MNANPALDLMSGVAVLEPLMRRNGFEYQPGAEGKGSGGPFASGSFVRGDRRLELHVRESLGLVAYHLGNASLDHETYMRFLGVYGQNRYPGFEGSSRQVFERLKDDLSNFASDFLSGSGQQFGQFAEELQRNPGKFKGLKAADG